MTTQDPELSAALGWPGGIGDPVLARTQLLQMVAALRLASQQALEALEHATPTTDWSYMITAIRAALAQEQVEPDISRCPQCNGPADNGFDRSFPPSPYLCTKCMAEPVEPVAALIAQRDVLLEALKTYGWHTEDCPQYPTHARPKDWPACTCGFDAAIALIEGRVKAVEEGK